MPAAPTFCEPIGHLQRDGDYRESWQPQPMSTRALALAQGVARSITDELGGWGVFGVELFVKGDEVWFSRSLAASARHRPGHAGVAGPERIRAACARDPRACRFPAIRQLGPVGIDARCSAQGHGVPVFGSVEGALAGAGHRSCACSASRGWRATAGSAVTLGARCRYRARRACIAREAAAAITIELR